MFTRRGKLVVVLVAACLYMAYLYGGRALNAVVVPSVIALAAGYLQLRRLDRPVMHRRLPADGFPGTTRSVAVDLTTDDTVSATIRDTLGPGLESATNEAKTLIGQGAFSYDVTYEERGRHVIGPLTVRVTDLFGFTERTFIYSTRERITVYPMVRALSGGLRTGLHRLATSTARREREMFDRLREYDRGDSLRDVHWKSSAKRPEDDLVVKEFTSEETLGQIMVAAETHDRRDDELATVTASVVTYLLDVGFSVGLRTTDETVRTATGADHRRQLLETLATLDPGGVPEEDVERADLHIYTPQDGSEPVLEMDDRMLRVTGVDEFEQPLDALGGGFEPIDPADERTEVPAT